MKSSIILLGAAALAALLVSCGEDGPKFTTLAPGETGEAFYTLPAGYAAEDVDSATLALTNLSAKTTEVRNLARANGWSVEDGLYNMTLTVYAKRTIGANTASQTLRDTKTNVRVSGGSLALSFAPKAISGGEGFVLAEICATSKLAEGLSYYSFSGWFRIYNNSQDTLYADRLCVFESDFMTVDKQTYTPDIMSQAVAVGAIYQVPGRGRDVPVAPGGSIVIANQARDHTKDNALSFDLSRANFETYDESGAAYDIDNPDVPNMVSIYTYSWTVWIITMQSNKSYGIGYIGGAPGAISNEQYITDYKYNYTYEYVYGDFRRTMEGDSYMFPNDWVLDFVNISPRTEWEWNVCDQSLDAGHVSVGETSGDPNGLGKAPRRKFANGRLVDTNNSANDFEIVDADPWHEFK